MLDSSWQSPLTAARCHSQAEADRQVEEQRERYSRASSMVHKMQRQLRARPGSSSSSSSSPDAGGGGGSLEADIQLLDVKEVTRAMLLEVRALAGQHPELGQAFADAGIKLPTATGPGSSSSSRAASAQGSRAGSLQGSRAASVVGSKAGSFKSAASQQSVRSNASRSSQPSIKTMELQL